MAIKLAGIKCELREVFLKDKPEQMISISNKGTVPVLQLPDGDVIDESLDVMLWALASSDPENWLDADRIETIALINENDFVFKEHLDRYKYHVQYPENPQIFYRKCAEEFLQKLEKRLENYNGCGLLLQRSTLADVAIFPFIRQFAQVDRQWFDNSEYDFLKLWLNNFEANQLFRSVMNKYDPWKPGNHIELFG